MARGWLVGLAGMAVMLAGCAPLGLAECGGPAPPATGTGRHPIVVSPFCDAPMSPGQTPRAAYDFGDCYPDGL